MIWIMVIRYKCTVNKDSRTGGAVYGCHLHLHFLPKLNPTYYHF